MLYAHKTSSLQDRFFVYAAVERLLAVYRRRFWRMVGTRSSSRQSMGSGSLPAGKLLPGGSTSVLMDFLASATFSSRIACTNHTLFVPIHPVPQKESMLWPVSAHSAGSTAAESSRCPLVVTGMQSCVMPAVAITPGVPAVERLQQLSAWHGRSGSLAWLLYPGLASACREQGVSLLSGCPCMQICAGLTLTGVHTSCAAGIRS